MCTACVTRRTAAILILVALTLTPGFAEAQRAEGGFQRTLTVSGPVELDVVTGSGSIDVRSGAAGRVEITARIQAQEGWRRGVLSVEERVRRLEAEPPIEQTANRIRVGHISQEELREGVSISYTVLVPAETRLKSKTGSGSQQIEGVRGDVETSSGSGSLTFRDIGSGLRASTGSGSLRAEGVAGAFHGTTGSGSVRATGVTGAITAETGSGGIEVEQTGSGDVQVSSGSGSVRLRGVRGAVRATTASGGLAVHGELLGDWRLSAASGKVRVDLPPGQAFELDASTGSGSIDVKVPVTVTGVVSRRSLRGTVHGGGPMLHVRTASGGISIQ